VHYLERKKGIHALPLSGDEKIELSKLKNKVEVLKDDIREI
jgi:hypothetical protein